MKFLVVMGLFVFSAFSVSSVAAQNCMIVPEAVVKLRVPDIGAFNVWDTVFGDAGMGEKFSHGLVRDNGHIVAVGERFKAGEASIDLVLTEYDRRGRQIWHVDHELKALQEIVAVLAHKDGFAVLANKNDGPRAHVPWVGVFDFNGVLKYQRAIRVPNIPVKARDIIPAPDGKGYVLAVSAKGKAAGEGAYSLFVRLNDRFQFVSKRAYKPGLANEILALSAYENSVVASGYIKNARGRENGWLMRLESDGAIAWQEQYTRGRGARLTKTLLHGNGNLLVLGEALPARRDDLNAGWVMMVEGGSGRIVWQRYYTSDDYAYIARDGLVSADGLISILLDGEKPDAMGEDDIIKDQAGRAMGNRSDYVRLLTLDPRGMTFNSMHFFHGEGADAFDLLRGNVRERILVGGSDMMHEEDDGNMIKSADGWVLAAPPVDLYQDPCGG